MNICMFTNTFWPHVGGVARSVGFFSEDLVSSGHRVLIIAPEYEDAGESTEPGDYHVYRTPAWQNFNGSDFSLRIPTPFILDRRINEFEPDIIHSHHPYLLGDAALRAARKRDLPLIFTHHTLYEQYTHYTPAESETMKRFVINLSVEYANLCSRIIAPSESIEHLLRDRGVVSPVEVVPTGVDLDFFQNGQGDRFRNAFQMEKEDFVIGHIGRLAPEKNLEYLAEAAALLVRARAGVKFLVVGDGPSSEDIRRIFKDFQVEDRLVMPGKATGRDLADAYQAMDLFIFSSKSETQGMVLVEAMAADKPVMALDASGAREVVDDNRNGRLLPGNASPQDFFRAMDECVTDKKKAGLWAKGAHETAQGFSRRITADKLLNLYKNATEAHDRPGPEEEVDFPGLLSIVHRLKAEWELFSEKTAAAVHAVSQVDDIDE